MPTDPTRPGDDDAQLRALLREWQVPQTPPSLEERVLRTGARRLSWWRFLLNGYIRVPVWVACGVVVLITAGVSRVALQPPTPCVAERSTTPASRVARSLPRSVCDHLAPGAC